MLRTFYIILFGLILASCSSNIIAPGYEARNLDQYYVASGVVRYFLQELPFWANVSSSASCRRSSSHRLLNFEQVGKSFNLSYFELVQFQSLLNRMLIQKMEVSKLKGLPLDSEEEIFYHVLDRINAKFYPFIPPKFKRINLIWIDPYIKDEKISLKITKNSEIMDSAPPVILSLCFNQFELEKILKKSGLEHSSVKYISSESLTPYDDKLHMDVHLLKIDLEQIFQSKSQIYFYTPDDIPAEFVGTVKKVIIKK